MSGELLDHDPQKWVYTEHARAEHAIQRNYLGAWLAILGTRFSPLVLFDGFAGRGRYEGGEDGSPLLFWKRAVEAVESGRPTQVFIRCVELDKHNFADLQGVIATLRHPGVAIGAVNGAFAEEAVQSAKRLSTWDQVPPVFWTADPYGFRGVPLDAVRELMSLPRSEVLVTFMVRDMRRFLGEPNFDVPLTEFFGGEAWRDCLARAQADDRESCLMLTYSRLIRSGVARFATPFRVFEDERRQTLYYLVQCDRPASAQGSKRRSGALGGPRPSTERRSWRWLIATRSPSNVGAPRQLGDRHVACSCPTRCRSPGRRDWRELTSSARQRGPRRRFASSQARPVTANARHR